MKLLWSSHKFCEIISTFIMLFSSTWALSLNNGCKMKWNFLWRVRKTKSFKLFFIVWQLITSWEKKIFCKLPTVYFSLWKSKKNIWGRGTDNIKSGLCVAFDFFPSCLPFFCVAFFFCLLRLLFMHLKFSLRFFSFTFKKNSISMLSTFKARQNSLTLDRNSKCIFYFLNKALQTISSHFIFLFSSYFRIVY